MHHSLPNVRFARYADDWCVFLTRCDRQYAERLRDEIRDFLRETCGLELSAEKTRITHVRDGYDFLGFNISVGVGKSGELVPKVKVGRKAITNIQTPLGRSHSLPPNAGKHLGPSCPWIGGHSWLVELLQDCPQLLASCQRAGPQGFLDRGESHLSESRHINGQVPPQAPLRRTPSVFTKTVPWPASQDTAASYYYAAPEPYQPGPTSRYLEDDEWEAAFVLPRTYAGQDAETSSGRLWFATAFIAVAARSWSHPRPRRRTISEPVNRFANLEMANSLDNIQTLCLRCHKLKTRGNNEYRIIWKAGCLETCTSGLGLGPG